jgi:carbon storage regulator CsrA
VPQCELSLTIRAIKGKTVQLAISAPAEIQIFREEIWQQVRRQMHREALPNPCATTWRRIS